MKSAAIRRSKFQTFLLILALLWNIAGLLAVCADAFTVFSNKAPQATHPPVWVMLASITAVFCGTSGTVCLLLRLAWAKGLLLISLIAILIQDSGFILMASETGGLSVTVLELIS